MRWWISGFFGLLIILFTLVVVREQKSGGACYEQSSSQNAANPLGVVIEEETSPQQTNSPATNSESYPCRLITPANLATDYLVIIGIGGVIVAIFTLSIIKRQTAAAEIAAVAARDNVELIITKERARIYVEPDSFDFNTADADNPTFELKYKITCSGTTPAIIYDSRVAAETNVAQERVEPERWAPIPLPNNLVPGMIEAKVPLFGKSEYFSEVLGEQIERGELFVNFWGYINYRDLFFQGDGFRRKNFRYIWDSQKERFIRCGEPWENAENRKTPPKNPN